MTIRDLREMRYVTLFQPYWWSFLLCVSCTAQRSSTWAASRCWNRCARWTSTPGLRWRGKLPGYSSLSIRLWCWIGSIWSDRRWDEAPFQLPICKPNRLCYPTSPPENTSFRRRGFSLSDNCVGQVRDEPSPLAFSDGIFNFLSESLWHLWERLMNASRDISIFLCLYVKWIRGFKCHQLS